MRTMQTVIRTSVGLFAFFAAIAPMTWLSTTAHANSNGDWSVFPVADETGDPGVLPRPYFDYRVPAGVVIDDEVVVTNLTDETLNLVLYPADAYNSENAGQFTLDLLSESRDFIGRWVQLSAGQLELPAQSRAVIPFQIVFPDDLPPGDYAGGIVALNQATESVDDTGFQVQNAVGTRIYARVGGASNADLEVTELDLDLSTPVLEGVTGDGSGELTYRITNVGNVRISGKAEASVDRSFADEIVFPDVDVPELLPGEDVLVTEQWSGLPPVGFLHAELTVAANEVDLEITRSTRAVVVPWWILGALVTLVLGVIGYRAVRRTVATDRSESELAAVTTVSAGRDTIGSDETSAG